MIFEHASHGFADADEFSAARLPDGPNLRWIDSWRGRLATARGNAELRVGPDWIRMSVHDAPTSPAGALRANAHLPSNLRCTGPRNQATLVADGWATRDTLPESIHEFRVGVRSAGPRARPWEPPASDASESQTALIEALDITDSGVDVVPLPSGWELGVRIRGRRVPTRITPEPDGLRLHKLLVRASSLETDSCVEASVCDAALRLNRRIRFARFALHKKGLVVEARLSNALLDEPKLVESAQAIAVVSQELGHELALLSRHPELARCYTRIFYPKHKENAA